MNDSTSPIENQLAAPPVTVQAHGDGHIDASTGSRTSDAAQLIHHRGAVLATLFLVTGALGLPLLWMNRRFSTAERIFWAIAVSLYTGTLIFIAGAVVMWSYRQIFG